MLGISRIDQMSAYDKTNRRECLEFVMDSTLYVFQ